jgi:hypothetical protein
MLLEFKGHIIIKDIGNQSVLVKEAVSYHSETLLIICYILGPHGLSHLPEIRLVVNEKGSFQLLLGKTSQCW